MHLERIARQKIRLRLERKTVSLDNVGPFQSRRRRYPVDPEFTTVMLTVVR